jgi:hypothetical protein
MVIKILSSAATFYGVQYNADKVDEGKGELMNVANFGLLREFTNIRPEDYKHFLKMLSSLNSGVKKPQFHATISTEGKTHNKYELTLIAEKWLKEMGYGDQPYLIVFHNDTDNNHVHIVSCRIDYNGKKISDSFEYLRSIQAMNRIMGVDEKKMIEKAKDYHFTTAAQFKLLLEQQGFVFKDNRIIRSGRKVADFKESELRFTEPDKARAQQLRAIFQKYKGSDLESILKENFGVELVFHSKEGKPAYGYTVIDHAQKNVFKGSEIMRMNELLNGETKSIRFSETKIQSNHTEQEETVRININIANDVDDEKVHAKRRKKKGRFL